MCRYRFIVTGRVQGVFFRKHTKQKAELIGITGWCENTANGESVEGEIEGPDLSVQEMMAWLQHEGSPQSVINDSFFELLSAGSTRIYNSFDIRK